MKVFFKSGWYFLMALWLLSACGNSEEKQEEEKFKEVMSIHDEAMAYMGKIMDLNRKIKSEIEILQVDTLQNHSEKISALQKGSQQLIDANKIMMDWMHGFEKPEAETMSHDEIMAYYEQEEKKIDEVKKQMEASIEKASVLIEP
ncbi:hypothetical protein [Xanthovirga aplysinae]|uniref:hypothetical protein n=1 Tax=Xanthovirga aplysinae TaxID=2529853 RepID=UPI0012BC2409|nr:hypothetical protein [Xanthovirga aplysinae]MTI30347.1 hypothetical protein [Xanthovirga aplysinae]